MYSLGNPLGGLGSRGYSDPADYEDEKERQNRPAVREADFSLFGLILFILAALCVVLWPVILIGYTVYYVIKEIVLSVKPQTN